MTSRWFHGYRVGQRVEVLTLRTPKGENWTPGVVRSKTKAGYPVVLLAAPVAILFTCDLKNRIRPVRTLPEVAS